MSDVILAVLGRRERADAVLDAAARLLTLKPGSHLHALAVLERVSLHALEAEVLMSAKTVIALSEELEERRAALTAAFDRWVERAGDAGAGVQWRVVEGTAA